MGMSLRSAGSTFRCGMSLPRPRTQASHQGAKGRCVNSCNSRSTALGTSGPSKTISCRACSGSRFRASSRSALLLSTLRWYSNSASRSWSLSHSCALVPQTGARNSFSRRFISVTLLSGWRWLELASAGRGTSGLWKIVTNLSPTFGMRPEGPSMAFQSTRSSTLLHTPSLRLHVVRKMCRLYLARGTWNTTAPALTKTGSPSLVAFQPVPSARTLTSAAGSTGSLGSPTSAASGATPSSPWSSSTSPPTARIQPKRSSCRTWPLRCGGCLPDFFPLPPGLPLDFPFWGAAAWDAVFQAAFFSFLACLPS